MDPDPRTGESGPPAQPERAPNLGQPDVEPVTAAPQTLAAMARRYWNVIRPDRRLAVASVALALISGVFEAIGLGMLVPLLGGAGVSGGGGPFTDLLTALGFHERAAVWAAIVAFALMGLGAAVSKFGSDATAALARARAEARLRKDLTDRLMEMEWSAFQLMRFGEMASSLIMESSQVGAGVQQFIGAVGAIMVALVFAGLALLLSVRLTAVVVAFALVALLVLRPISRRSGLHTEGLATATAGIARQVVDVLGNLKFFRSTGSQRRAQELFAEGYDEYATWFQRTQVSPLLTRGAYDISALLFIAVLLAVSIAGQSTLSATNLAFLAIFLRLSPRISALQEGIVRTRVQFPWLTAWEERSATASAHRQRQTGMVRPTFSRGLIFDEVSFSFPGGESKVLDGISWEVRPGETVAFVGESGAGKTTILDLVTGLLAPTSGQIALDGVALGEIDIEAWQSHIGLVLQESPLFHASVRANVIGDREADDDLLLECLAASYAKSFVEELPGGLDRIIGERGGRLSGGQRQRLGLARALYRQPWLLILDEATSALDSVSESVVLEALAGLKGKVSMMIVAHRLATVELADRIYVLEAGHVVQVGSWLELLSDDGGLFAQLAAKQGLLTAD